MTGEIHIHSNSPTLPAIWGEGDQFEGVRGVSHNAHGGVVGINDGKIITVEGPGPGVYGESSENEGVRGVSHSAHGGVVGTNDGKGVVAGPGVYGESSENEGARGVSHSIHGGVVGSNDGQGPGVYGTSPGIGIFGESTRGGFGVSGVTDSSINDAVAGVSGSNTGAGYAVLGKGGVGLRGEGSVWNGVEGVNTSGGVGSEFLETVVLAVPV